MSRKFLVLALLVSCGLALQTQMVLAERQSIEVVEAEKTPSGEVFNVYTEKWSKKDHYYASGWMGDYGDIEINEGNIINPFNGRTCLKITYNAKRSQNAGWIGVYWQNPPNNWGDEIGGYDLTGYKKLTFWARGEKGGEAIAEFKIGGIGGTYPDSDSAAMGPVTLTKDWKEYTIDLKGIDLSCISGGFGFSARYNDNPNGFTFYMDDIRYEK